MACITSSPAEVNSVIPLVVTATNTRKAKETDLTIRARPTGSRLQVEYRAYR